MKKVNNNNKSSARKKLIPAAGSLMISAAMLSTSTYAWFTMSREVEVKNIKMTATVPEDIQISLGKLAVTGTPATAVTEDKSDANCLVNSTGVLYATSGSVAGDCNVAAPENSWDWSNSADISAYYDIGRLIPASSYDGTDIFFTPDANGVGKTVKGTANYIKATDKLATVADENTSAGNGVNKTYRATLHALTAARGTDTWAEGGDGKYTQASDYNKTFDDGYYVDIPIFLRTSSNQAVNISVDGYVLPGSLNLGDDASNKETDLELYRAVRVAILDGETVTEDNTTGAVACTAGDAAVAAKNSVASNIIPLKDAWDTTKNGAITGESAAYVANTDYTGIWAKQNVWDSNNTSILDSINLNQTVGSQTRAVALSLTGDFSKTKANGGALAGVSALGTQTTASDGVTTYTPGTYTVYNALVPTSETSPDTVATIAGSTTGGKYGATKKLIIRVWLDGEDGECWNDNAGQDWSISLKFSKIEATP